MVVLLVFGLALVALGILRLSRAQKAVRHRGPAVAYGFILAGAIVTLVSALAMAGLIRE